MYPAGYNPDCESVHCDCELLERAQPVIDAAIALAKERIAGFRSMSPLENAVVDAVKKAGLL